MNRENKRIKYTKGYYKNHACNDSFICKVCGRPVVSAGAGSEHGNHCPNCLWMKRQATVRQTAAELWSPLESGYARAASGQSFTGADAAGNSARIEVQQMTTP